MCRNYRFTGTAVPISKISPEFIPGLEFATVFLDLVLFHPHLAIGPAQHRVWPQREFDQTPADIRFNAWTYGRSRKRETHGPAEYRRIHLAYHVFQLRAKHLSLQRESRCVGPVPHLYADRPPAARK